MGSNDVDTNNSNEKTARGEKDGTDAEKDAANIGKNDATGGAEDATDGKIDGNDGFKSTPTIPDDASASCSDEGEYFILSFF